MSTLIYFFFHRNERAQFCSFILFHRNEHTHFFFFTEMSTLISMKKINERTHLFFSQKWASTQIYSKDIVITVLNCITESVGTSTAHLIIFDPPIYTHTHTTPTHPPTHTPRHKHTYPPINILIMYVNDITPTTHLIFHKHTHTPIHTRTHTSIQY